LRMPLLVASWSFGLPPRFCLVGFGGMVTGACQKCCVEEERERRERKKLK
jgi:hypothetical protein